MDGFFNFLGKIAESLGKIGITIVICCTILILFGKVSI
tara:strand:- start:2584 stop:2697 length:114 start_codon:yes stop_codon:yes gene_type:complete